MNISYNWLRDFVDVELPPAALAEVITSRAATVDAVEPLREDLQQFVVARVVECARHPDSDRLSITKVDAGTGELLDVVCGAPNVQAGKLYPFARTGTMMPAGFTIERRKIRGAVSNGMLCSAREIGLGEDQDGILELDIDVPPGTPLLQAMPSVSDARIIVDVGANRPDLLSHLGVAREVAAALNKPLQLDRAAAGDAALSGPRVAIASNPRQGNTGDVSVTIEDVDGCPRYLGVIIRGVSVGPSPDWLARRLEGAGVRSINSIVDITNFMLLGFGQPMHAFDAKRLAASAVVVRRARKGEKLVTLDGVERQLTEDMCVIADGDRAQALAGVMGGRDTEVTLETTDVFLEVAAFNPRRVRQMRRALSISSEAAYRFERGTDVAERRVDQRERHGHPARDPVLDDPVGLLRIGGEEDGLDLRGTQRPRVGDRSRRRVVHTGNRDQHGARSDLQRMLHPSLVLELGRNEGHVHHHDVGAEQQRRLQPECAALMEELPPR